MKFNVNIECDDADELAALIAKLNGKAAKPAKEDDDEPPAKKKPAKEDDDEPPAKKKGKSVEEKREEIREKLREYAEKTDRKTAIKVLNKFAESVDEVEEDDLPKLLEKLETLIDA